MPNERSPKLSRRDYLHVAQRIFNTPLLIDPRKLEVIVHGLRDRFGATIELPESAKAHPMAFEPSWDQHDWDSDLTITKGVAVLPIDSTLVHKGKWVGAYSGLQSYDGISEQLKIIRQKQVDGEVGALLLNMHSHGGEVAGCFDLVDEIYAMRGSMPIVALVADAACSAAYAIASAAEEVVITQTGYAGSIGVVYTHFDYTKMAEMMGVAVTHIHAGKDKVLGSPYKELTAGDRRKLQGEVDGLYEIFVGKVARNRGLDAQAIRETEANVFYAEDAIEQRLADRVVVPNELLAELQERVQTGGAGSRQANSLETTTMTTASGKKGAAGAKQGAADPLAEVESSFGGFMASLRKAFGLGKKSAAAEQDPEDAKAKNDEDYDDDEEQEEPPPQARRGSGPSAKAAVGRVKEILSSAEAKGRGDLAAHLAYDTSMSAKDAIALLAKSPKAEAAGGESPLERAMRREGSPGVSGEDGPAPAAAAAGAVPRIDSAKIFEARRKAAGHR